MRVIRALGSKDLQVSDLERKSAGEPRFEIEFEFGVEVEVVFEVVVVVVASPLVRELRRARN